MKETWVRISDQLLQDYVDGRLGANRARQVEAYLAAHPKARKAVEDLRKQNADLRRIAKDTVAEPIPKRFLDLLEKSR